MRLITLVLFCCALALPSSMASAQEAPFRLIPLEEGLGGVPQTDEGTRLCGRYFVAIETTVGRIIHFIYDAELPERIRVFAFYLPDEIVPLRDDKLSSPVAVADGSRIKIWMNGQDFGASLPCIGKGSNA